MSRVKKLNTAIIIFLITFNFFWGKNLIRDEFSLLLSKGDLKGAKEFLLQKKQENINLILKKYYIKLGNAFLSNRQFEESLFCFKASHSRKKKIKNLIISIKKKLGEQYILNRNYKKALDFYKKSKNKDLIIRLSYAVRGDENLLKGAYKKALDNYEKSGYLDRIAKCFGIIADDYKEKEKEKLAKSFFKKAIRLYNSELKSFHYLWNNEDNKDRLRCITKLKSFEKNLEEKTEELKLKSILKGVGEYCTKLKNESIYFYCKESIKELSYYSKGARKARLDPDFAIPTKKKKIFKQKKNILYSYQLIQEGDSIKETRQPLRSNSNQKWEFSLVGFNKIIFGPLGMFDFSWQPYYDYKCGLHYLMRIKQQKTVDFTIVNENES